MNLRWLLFILLPVILSTSLYLWLSVELPTPLWMRPFREDHFLIFKAIGIAVAPAYYLILFFLWRAKSQTDWIEKTHRLAEPHEIKRESILEMLLSQMFRHWFGWLSLIISALILLGSVVYFEGINEGTTYANQTYEQTGGWGILNVISWGIPIAFGCAFLIANRHRNLPQYIPYETSYESNSDYRDYMKSGKPDDEPEPERPSENSHFTGAISTEKEALELFEMSKPYNMADLKKRRMELLKKVHPDQGGSNMMARLVNEAYDVLKTKI